jgi:hypothetical protein
MLGVDRSSMISERYLTLRNLNRRRASINHGALAATLLAAESSRNSYLKFVHNVLILTGVFGTIISLSIALLGASDMIHESGQTSAETSGLGTMIFGMSTALSTTMTAIISYLIFGYFYIKLTDTQTYLISRVEEVTATTLLPHLQLNQDAVIKDYSDSIRSAGKLIQRFDQSQQRYEESVRDLRTAAQTLTQQARDSGPRDALSSNDEVVSLLNRLGQLQQQSADESRELLTEVVQLLQEGFRLRDHHPDHVDSKDA